MNSRPTHLYAVFSAPLDGQETEYNRWYDEQHLDDVLRVPGFVAAERFELEAPADDAPAPYLAVYELSCADPQPVLEQLMARAGTANMPLSPALDLSRVRAFLYRSITPRRNATPGSGQA